MMELYQAGRMIQRAPLFFLSYSTLCLSFSSLLSLFCLSLSISYSFFLANYCTRISYSCFMISLMALLSLSKRTHFSSHSSYFWQNFSLVRSLSDSCRRVISCLFQLQMTSRVTLLSVLAAQMTSYRGLQCLFRGCSWMLPFFWEYQGLLSLQLPRNRVLQSIFFPRKNSSSLSRRSSSASLFSSRRSSCSKRLMGRLSQAMRRISAFKRLCVVRSVCWYSGRLVGVGADSSLSTSILRSRPCSLSRSASLRRRAACSCLSFSTIYRLSQLYTFHFFCGRMFNPPWPPIIRLSQRMRQGTAWGVMCQNRTIL